MIPRILCDKFMLLVVKSINLLVSQALEVVVGADLLEPLEITNTMRILVEVSRANFFL